MEQEYQGSRVLVTGGTGSVGLELAKRLVALRPAEIRLFSNDENGLFEAKSILPDRDVVRLHLGDVRDNHSVDAVVDGCDYVFHAAALKHVNFCEGNPYEAITTNIMGTQNLIESSIKHRVSKFVFISTDKAVNPVSAMGATKLLGEKLVISASKSAKHPVFSVVRFGNVLGSRGSATVIFDRQVRDGKPMTITDERMTRFIMNPAEAAQLVVRAALLANPGEVFVLKMKAVRIGDFGAACREFFAKNYNKDARSIEVKKIGAQPGEKMHEELMTNSEAETATDLNEYYVVNPGPERRAHAVNRIGKGAVLGYSSNNMPLLTKGEIIAELSRLYSRVAVEHPR